VRGRDRNAVRPPRRAAGRALALLALAPLLAALPGCQRGGPRHTALPPGSTVLALGDSLTYGTGAPPGQAYPDVLARLTGWQVVNAGVPGHTSAQALERTAALLAQHRPALLIVSIGGNDFLRGISAERTREHLRGIAAAAREAGVPVLLVAVPRPTLAAAVTRTLDDHPLYPELAAELDLALHPNGWSEVLSDARWRSDRIHANAEGYARFAEGLLGTLRELGWAGR
jgi:acyl-CoA thioesterase I